jgi:hypothetical protein
MFGVGARGRSAGGCGGELPETWVNIGRESAEIAGKKWWKETKRERREKLTFAVFFFNLHTAIIHLPCSKPKSTRQSYLCCVPSQSAHGEGFTPKCCRHAAFAVFPLGAHGKAMPL